MKKKLKINSELIKILRKNLTIEKKEKKLID